MKRLLLTLALLLLPSLAAGQGARRYDDIAWKYTSGGTWPAGNATVTVCTAAGTGIPCAPLATIYSDANLTQPITGNGSSFTSDGRGNYGFWAPAGTYVITITGVGLQGYSKTILLPASFTELPNTTLAFNATPAFDGTVSQAYSMTLAGNVTSSSIIGTPTNGNLLAFHICQDGVGSHTFVWPANFLSPTTIQSAINSCTDETFKYNGTQWSQLTQPASGGGGGGTPAGPPNCVQTNAGGGLFGCGPQVNTVAINPQTNDNICYVSPNGNDTNDGLSIGTGHAKLTIYSCLTTVLPGGAAGIAGNGTVMTSGTVSYGGPVANQGMWLMGPSDPNFASPPSGWLKTNGIGPLTITIDCFARYTSGVHGHTGRCGFSAGTAVGSLLPPVWISSVAGNITINNMQFNNFIGNYIRYGIDSNNNRNGTGGASGFALNNVGYNSGGCPNLATGPGLDIGSQSFWIWVKELDATGCPSKIFTVAASGAVRTSGVTTVTTTATNDISSGETVTIANVTNDSFNGSFVATQVDTTHFTYPNPGPNATSGTGQVVTSRASAINMDSGSTGTGTGLIFIDDTNLSNGNIRFKPGSGTNSFYVRNVSYEGNFSAPDAPPILITGTPATSNADGTTIKIDNVEAADNTNFIPLVQVDNNGAFPGMVVVSRIAGTVRGKMVTLDGVDAGNESNISYLRRQQYGLRQGQLVATGIDDARRGFSPTVAKGTNIAITTPSSWTFTTGTGTVTSGINTTGLDSTSNAGRVTFISGVPSAVVQFYGSAALLNLGDTYVGGVWVRSATNNGYPGSVSPTAFILNNNGAGSGDTCAAPQGNSPSPSAVILANLTNSVQSDGQWQWYSFVCKITANPTTPGAAFQGFADSTHTVDFYAPTLYLFPSGTISDNEAYEIALNMGPVPSTAAAGEARMLPGQVFGLPDVLFANLGTPNNGAIVHCPNCAAQNPCTSPGPGAVAQRIAGAWNCSGSAGGGIGTGTQNAVTYWLTTNSLGSAFSNVSGQIPTYQNGGPPLPLSPSFTDSSTSPVTTTPYTIGCDTATALVDRGHSIRFQSGASAITVPLSTASGCPGLVTTAVNDNAATLTFTRTTGDTLTVCNGLTCLDTQTSFTLSVGQDATIAQNAPNLWLVRIHTSGGGVSALSGDTGLFCNVSSTGAVTLVPCTTTLAHKFWGNNTGSTGTAAFVSIGVGDLPTGIPNANLANASTTVNTQTCTLGSTCTIGFANIAAGAIANGSTCTTQAATDSSTDCATDAFVKSATLVRRVCDIAVGDQSGAAIANSQLGPQKRMCFIPAAAVIVEMDVAADGGTPNVIVAVNHAGTVSNIVSAALATAASGGIACSKTTAVTCIDGVTTASATLQNTTLAAGDYLELVSGTAGGTAKLMTIHIIYTVN